MRRVILWGMAAAIIAAGDGVWAAHPAARDADVTLSGPSFPVGDRKFTIPSKWQIEPVEGPGRGGQWHVPPLHGVGEGGEVVVFYFGPGIGGTSRENIDAWIGCMANADGKPAAAEVKHRETSGLKISEAIIFGTYSQVISIPGIPPQPKPNYGLLGAAIENPQGGIYWRLTGPEPLVTATIPLFDKVIDSVKPQDK